MEIKHTDLHGVLIISPKRYVDDRGYFFESYNKITLEQYDIDYIFVQDNHSFSADIGTVRGLHFQSPPHAQCKLVRASKGRIFDVAVDIRKGSSTFKQWVGVELSAENGKQLLIPEGFLHGFMTLEDDCEVQYKCTDIYAPEYDGAVRFDDKDIGIKWPLPTDKAILSDKDRAALYFEDFDSPFK